MGKTKSETPSFAIYLMFSEGLQFNSSEIAAALLEDFPGLDITPGTGLDIPMPCDTDAIIPMAPILMGAGGADAAIVNMTRLPGYCTWDPNGVQPAQLLACADYDMNSALSRNKSYLCISVGAKSKTLQDRFRAARLASCVGAVFAQLPICLGAYWETGDHFLSPQGVCDMANEAMKDEWPVRSWVGLGLAPLGTDKVGVTWSQGSTKGLRHFTDYEVTMPATPYDVARTATSLWGIAWLPLVSGNQFADGHTVGGEGEGEADKLRLRWATKGMTDKAKKSPPLPFDCFMAIHPRSLFDEKAYFGRRKAKGGPTMVVEKQPRPGFFRRMMSSGQS